MCEKLHKTLEDSRCGHKISHTVLKDYDPNDSPYGEIWLAIGIANSRKASILDISYP